MKKRIYSAIVMVILIALMFVLKIYVSDLFFDALFCFVACVGAYEMSKLLTKMGMYNFLWVATFFPILLLGGNLLGVHFATKTADLYWIVYTILIDLAIMVFAGCVCMLFSICRRKAVIKNEMTIRKIENISVWKFSFKKALNTFICFFYPAFVFLLFVLVNHMNALPFAKLSDITSNVSVFAITTALLIPVVTDIFAMLTGSIIGGKKLCPKISPNKTISGSVGGTLWCVMIAACVYLIFANIISFESLMAVLPIWAYLLIVFFGSLLAQGGDLFESVIKRRADVKDSGNFIPGHGGMLDRTDSHIFMAPYIFLTFMLVLV